MDLAAPAPRFGNALLALTAAATIAVAPVAAAALGPAGSGSAAHSVPVYVLARLAHDIGHNDWAFQGQADGRTAWVIAYAGLALFWLAVALWVRHRSRGAAEGAPGAVPAGLWWRVLLAALGAEAAAGCLTIGAGLLAAWSSWTPDALVLHAADLCSPWWSCVAAGLVVARAEHSWRVLRAVLGYGLLLAVVLAVPLPLPDLVRVLVLAVPAALPALLKPEALVAGSVEAPAATPGSPDAAAAG